MLTERELLNQLPRLPDLQCAWLLLAMCASPRANHALRTVPPLDIAGYAQAHDDAVWETLQACLGGVASGEADGARKLATLPASLGGLGLSSAVRTAPAAYTGRHGLTHSLCLASAPRLWPRHASANWREGTQKRLASVVQRWHATSFKLKAGRSARPGEQSRMVPAHQWRLTGASATGRMAGSTVRRALATYTSASARLLPDMSPSACALLRSQAGPHAGAWLTAIPADPATTLSPQAMQLALRRRLRLPLPLRLNRCGPSPGCGGLVDVFGDHALACPRTGLLARRAKIVERAWVRVAREAVGADGQVVPQQWLCATTAPGVAPDDRRRLDLVIYGASPMGGALCCDATLVSPLTRTGQPQPGTVEDDGAMLRVAERRKRAAYPELSSGGPAAAPRARLRDRRALERNSTAACERLGARASPTGPAGTASRSHLRLDETVVGDSGCSGAASCEQHGARKPVARAPAREPASGPGARPCARPRRSSGAEPTAATAVAARRR